MMSRVLELSDDKLTGLKRKAECISVLMGKKEIKASYLISFFKNDGGAYGDQITGSTDESLGAISKDLKDGIKHPISVHYRTNTMVFHWTNNNC